jgi:hypothetical protein
MSLNIIILVVRLKCICMSMNCPPHYLLNAWTNLCKTLYVYRVNWPHLTGVHRKSLPSLCVFVCVSIPSLLDKGSVNCIFPFNSRQWLGRHVPAAKNAGNNRKIVGCVCLWVCVLNLKGCVRWRPRLNLRCCRSICHEEFYRSMRNFSHNNRCFLSYEVLQYK